MLQHIYRAQTSPGAPKPLFDTNLVISTQNHKSNHCNRHCTYYNVPDDVAIIIHYRNSCKGNNKNEACKPSNSVKDTEIWKYKDELINRTTNVLKRLKLI